MDFGTILPPRSVEDTLSERVRLVIGGEVFDLPVLSLFDNTVWKEQADFQLGLLVANITTTDDLTLILGHFDGYEPVLMDLLQSYDISDPKVLPDRDVIARGLTPLGLFKAVLEVWRAARPLASIAAAGMTLTPEPPTNGWQQRLSSRLRRTTGRPAKYGAN